MNRVDFIVRALTYYAKIACEHTIYIGDASNESNSVMLQSFIRRITGKLKINYFHWPNVSISKTIYELSHLVVEKYSCIICDDDFIIPSSVSKCATFLQNNQQYRTAQGKALLFSLLVSGPYGRVLTSSTYWNKVDSEWESAHERLEHFARRYWVPQFSVHRTNEFVQDMENYADVGSLDVKFGEILSCFMFICNGKSKSIDCLYLIRQAHNERYLLPEKNEWLKSEHWQQTFDVFCETVGCALSRQDAVAQVDAIVLVRKLFEANYLLGISELGLSPNKSWLKFLGILKQSLLLRKFVLHARIRKGEMNHLALLKKSSPYYHDFLQVYDVIAK